MRTIRWEMKRSTGYLGLLSACRAFDLLPCWDLEWAAPELWFWVPVWRPAPESCWLTLSYWLPWRPLQNGDITSVRVSSYICERCCSILTRKWAQNKLPPAWSLLTVWDGGSHGWVWHHSLPRVVNGHARHLLPCGRDEDLLCSCWPALLCEHMYTSMLKNCKKQVLSAKQKSDREDSMSTCLCHYASWIKSIMGSAYILFSDLLLCVERDVFLTAKRKREVIQAA